jgi:hypothetical protein
VGAEDGAHHPRTSSPGGAEAGVCHRLEGWGGRHHRAGWGRVARASLPGSVEQVRRAVVETRAARWVRSNLRG